MLFRSGRLTGVRPATYNSSSGYSEILNAENVTYDYNANGYLESITTASTTYNFSYNAFGNSSSIKVGSTQIASYEYYNNNGNLKKIHYGNGHTEEYKYNELDLLTEVWYNQGTSTELVYSYEYTSDGQLYKFTNHTTNESIVYKYDLSNRLCIFKPQKSPVRKRLTKGFILGITARTGVFVVVQF